MAKRRKLHAAMQGLGEGIGVASQYMLRSRLADKSQDRIDERANRAAAATADRQSALAEDAVLFDLIKEASKNGDVDPSQIATIAKLLGRDVDDDALEGVNPLRRRLETSLGKSIGDATSPEAVPGDADITGVATARGGGLPAEWFEGVMPAVNDPFERFHPEVREIGERAGAKRRALMEKPTDIVTGTDDQGANFSTAVSKYGLKDPFRTSPTAAAQGALKGEGVVAELGVAGGAKAEQAGREAGASAEARQDVEMSDSAVAARVAEAARKEAATMSAALPYQLRLAKEQAAIASKAAVDKDQALATVTAARAAGELAPFFERFRDLTAKVNTSDGITARAGGVLRRGRQMLGGDATLSEIDNLVNQNLRRMAIAMGVREANVSEKETAQAMKGIGWSALNTATERQAALRNVYDLITIAPVVAANTGGSAGIQERMDLALGFMRERRAAEAEAIKQGFGAYVDPVTGAVTKVIQ